MYNYCRLLSPKIERPFSTDMLGVKRELGHIEVIADAGRYLLPQSFIRPRTLILGTVYFWHHQQRTFKFVAGGVKNTRSIKILEASVYKLGTARVVPTYAHNRKDRHVWL